MEEEVRNGIMDDDSLLTKYLRYEYRYFGNATFPDPSDRCKSKKCRLKVVCKLQNLADSRGFCVDRSNRSNMVPVTMSVTDSVNEYIAELNDMQNGLLQESDLDETFDSLTPLRQESSCA